MTDNLFDVDLMGEDMSIRGVAKEETGLKVGMQIDSPRWLWDGVGHLQFHLEVELDSITSVVARFQQVWQELAVEFDVQIPQPGDDNASAGGVPATDKQLAFLRRLGVEAPAGITKDAASELIERNTVGPGGPGKSVPAGTGDGPPATPKQIEYIRTLLKRVGRNEPQGLDGYTKSAASRLISELLKAGR